MACISCLSWALAARAPNMIMQMSKTDLDIGKCFMKAKHVLKCNFMFTCLGINVTKDGKTGLCCFNQFIFYNRFTSFTSIAGREAYEFELINIACGIFNHIKTVCLNAGA